ncbi:hypothetical protein FSARC_13718 [Fusarium sarcochroum]|uniref:F-box domain-containing protein n=1 Tax=Fusarium sarcochroum TaxID=1208366 RepID=A0A8H4SZK1_9HYPO|nr:hypothetical protein FSARC_13718 [Fusarium sarcochroum]
MDTKSKTPACLSSCPDEVQLLILKELPEYEDLRSMALINKRFCNIAQPVLIRDIFVGWEPGSSPCLTTVIRTLLDRPDLANEVKSLRLDGHEFPDRCPDVMPTMSVAALNMLKVASFIEKTGADFADAWAEAVSDGEIDALVTLLIALVPRVKEIYLGPDFSIEIYYLEMMFDPDRRSKPGVELPAHEHLRALTVRNETVDSYHSWFNFTKSGLVFFNISQLHALSIAAISSSTPMFWPKGRPQALKRLVELHLHRVRESQLEGFFSLTPNMRVLRWVWSWNPEHPEVFTNVIDVGMLESALETRMTDLETLDIQLVDDAGIEDPTHLWAIQMQGELNELRYFCVLRQLIIPLTLLMGYSSTSRRTLRSKIPSCLISLCLTDDLCQQLDYDWSKKSIRSLIHEFLYGEIEVSRTDIRSLSIAGATFHDVWTAEEVQILKDGCRRHDIDLDVLDYTPAEFRANAEIEARGGRRRSCSCATEVEDTA